MRHTEFWRRTVTAPSSSCPARSLPIELRNARSTATRLRSDWVMAVTSHHRAAAELADTPEEGETVRVVLDDGLPHEAGN